MQTRFFHILMVIFKGNLSHCACDPDNTKPRVSNAGLVRHRVPGQPRGGDRYRGGQGLCRLSVRAHRVRDQIWHPE